MTRPGQDPHRHDGADGLGPALGVRRTIDVDAEVERRVTFLLDAMTRAHRSALILGISGGVDSAAAAALCARAVERHRRRHGVGRFVAVRLPYGVQADADDVDVVLGAIRADDVCEVDIKPGTDAIGRSLRSLGNGDVGVEPRDDPSWDRLLGNIKARVRMVVQYALAEQRQGLVVGTDHAAEAVMGFFTKFGDGACDVVPLAGLTKRQVRALAGALGIPDTIVTKRPTADLETLRPQLPDEEALGIGYDAIDDVLEGRGEPDALRIVSQAWTVTAHKRALPYGPDDALP